MSVLVGRAAPEIKAPAVLKDGTLVNEYSLPKGKYALIVFYPLDFTFVCPSELIALDHRCDVLHEKGVEVVSVSVDSHFTHNAWRKTPIKEGGIGPVKYTMVADINHKIMEAYGVEHPEAGVAFRASFLIDQKGVVRHQVVNDLPLGRDMDELIRMVDALQFFDEHGEVCPAGWQKGQAGMKADTKGVAEYLAKHADKL
ncbi:MAG: peroxiredoxin [Gammaproteobacteria bacterium]|nr:peroxiredoxin [Gammaproteobacteria bacterium]